MTKYGKKKDHQRAVLLRKLTVAQQLKRFQAFLRRDITVFVKARRHW
jgi:hypothetical protein